jgi:hypothetical protein
MLPDCKDYFQNHSHLNSCFNDLKPIVCRFSVAELREFMTFTLTWTNELLGGSETSVSDSSDSLKCFWLF